MSVRKAGGVATFGRWAGALALCLSACTAWSAPVPWPEVSFSYLANRDPLSKVLTALGEAFGIRVRLSEGLRTREPLLNGNLTMPTATQFLDKLSTTQGLTWFYDAGVLYVGRVDENVTRVIPVPGMTSIQLRQALIDLGILDGRFGWAEFADRGVVMVSGPPPYIDLVAHALSGLPDVPVEQQVKVFKLRHASVDDRSIQYRDRQLNTAGVATLLRGLVKGLSVGGASTTLVEGPAPLRSLVPAPGVAGADTRDDADASTAGDDRGDRSDRDDGARGATASAAGRRRPPPAVTSLPPMQAVILADTLQNAVIIKDRPRNMPIYEQLIAILDVPSYLVEIEATIIDVDASKLVQYGIDWRFAKGRVGASLGAPGLAAPATSATLVLNAGNLLLSRVQALESSGDATVLARPSILTQDNMGALIDLADTRYIQTPGPQSAVVPVTAGVTLRVTPHVVEAGGEKSVQLALDIEDGSVSTGAGSASPIVHRSTISTQAVIGENESLLVGGFKGQNKSTQKDGLPLLGNLPVVGALFSKTSEDTDRRERMFLITPRIVIPASMAEARSAAEAGKP